MSLAHDVFFTLNDSSPAQCDALVRECFEYLKGHDGVVAFSAGTRAAECKRDVNDVQFHVSLHIVFADRRSHDAYETAPRHREFIARNKANWAKVRVFDSTIESAPGSRSLPHALDAPAELHDPRRCCPLGGEQGEIGAQGERDVHGVICRRGVA